MKNFFNMIVKSMFKQLDVDIKATFGTYEYGSRGCPNDDNFEIACNKFKEALQEKAITSEHLDFCKILLKTCILERETLDVQNLKIQIIDKKIEDEKIKQLGTLYKVLSKQDGRSIDTNLIRKFFFLTLKYAHFITQITPMELRGIGIIEKKIAEKKKQKSEASIKEQQILIQKKPSPKLDEEMRKELESIGVNVETEEELYILTMNFAFQLLEEGTDDDFAFSLLNDLYEVRDLQDNICGFAIKLYENNDYERAFKIFLGLAKQEHDIAQTYLGDCYLYGKGVNRNLETAYNWYTKVADSKNAEGSGYAQVRLVMGLLEMAHKEEDDSLLQRAISAAKKYAELENAQVQYILACAYRNGKGVEVNDKLAHFWMGEAAKNGLIDAIKIMNEEET